jgi:flagellar protein FlaF
MSIEAYRRAQENMFDARAAEHRALATVNGRLQMAMEGGWTGARLVDALHDNRMLWQSFADDCASAGNGLSDETRAGIIGIALWVNRHSSEVARGRESAADLIALNKTIMEGLATRAGRRGPTLELVPN